MKLKKYLNSNNLKSVALLYFNKEGGLCMSEYKSKDKVDIKFMDAQVMEVKNEDDCTEIWIK